MRPKSRWLTIVTLFALVVVGTASEAVAATTTCSFNGGILTIASDANANNGEWVSVVRSGQLILVKEQDETGEHLVDCGSPTLSQTLKIDYTGTAPTSDFQIDESGGAFVTSTGQEVLFDVHMPAEEGAYATVSMLAGSTASRVVAGANGVDLHDDGDVDLTMSNVDSLLVAGSPVGDMLSGAGGGSRGGRYPSRVVLLGYGGNDTLRGGSAGDLLLGGAGGDSVYGGPGDDDLGAVQALYNTFDANGTGNDRLYGESGDDELAGGSDNDLLVGGPGADSMAGMTGVDTVSYAASPSRVTVRLDGAANDGRTIEGSSEGDSVANSVENVIGSPYADWIVGNAGDNRFTGGNGNDMLAGMDGEDVLSGQDGNDTLKGGLHTDTCYGGAGTDTLRSCENP